MGINGREIETVNNKYFSNKAHSGIVLGNEHDCNNIDTSALKSKENTIKWNDIRIDIARETMIALIGRYDNPIAFKKEIVKDSIDMTERLIKELKKKME